MNIDPRLTAIADAQPYPLVFATISGAHLYGFPSADSDFDLRGAHVLPLAGFAGLETRDETLEDSRIVEGLEMDIVSHDVRKFFRLLLKKNGYVLEQLHSPLVVRSSAAHHELREIAQGCVTRHHAHHYLGFSATQWQLFLKGSPRRVKPLLYVYRVLLTGIRLMRTGRVEANLVALNQEVQLSWLDDLIACKIGGREKEPVPDGDMDFLSAEYVRLRELLIHESERSTLPDTPSGAAHAQLNDLLLRLRADGLPRRQL